MAIISRRDSDSIQGGVGVSFLSVFPFGRTFTLHRTGASVTPEKSVKNSRWQCKLGTGPIILKVSGTFLVFLQVAENITEELRAMMTPSSFQLEFK